MLISQPYEVFNSIPLTCFQGVGGSKLFLVHTMAEWDVLYAAMMQRKTLTIDTETNGFRWWAGDRIVGMSFGWSNLHFYVPVRHEDSLTDGPQPAQLDMDILRPQLQILFARKDLTVTGHNLKFDYAMYKADGILIKCAFHDTSLMWQIVDENAPAALKKIASGWKDIWGIRYKGLVDPNADADSKFIKKWRAAEAKARKKAYSDAVKLKVALRAADLNFQGWKVTAITKWVKEHDMLDHKYYNDTIDNVHYGYLPIVDMTKYAALDTFLTVKVQEYCEPKIRENKKFSKLYLNELKLSRVLASAEEHGQNIDVEYLERTGVEFAEEIKRLEEIILLQLKSIPGVLDEDQEINLSSSKQLIVAFTRMGIELTKLSKSGKSLALDKKVLTKLAKKHQIAKDLLALRKIQKLKEAFVDGILKTVVDGKVHPSFRQNVSTGRLGVSSPNTSQIPSKNKSIKMAFTTPSDEFFYLFFDYSQVEVRLTAHYSDDPVLVDAYNTGEDVHLKSSCLMFGLDYLESKEKYKDENHPEFKEIDTYRKIGKCFHPDTECLTKSGWKKMGDLLPNEEVIQAIPYRDGKKGKVNLEWVVPTEHFKFKHDSKKLVHLKNEGIDLRVTPDHRMLAFTNLGYPKVVMPHELVKQRYWLNAGILPDSEHSWTPDPTLLKLAVATQTDGCYEGSAIRLRFTKKRKADRLREILGDRWLEGLDWTSSQTNANGKVLYNFRLKSHLTNKVKALLDEDKTLPWSWLSLSIESREIVLAEFQYWDGGQYEKWTKFNYFSVIPKNREIVQALAHISGRKTRDIPGTLAVKNRDYSRGESLYCHEYDFTDDVVCVSVPSTFLLVKDNGIAVVVGQTVNFGIIYGVGAPGLSEQIPRPAQYANLEDEEWVDTCKKFIDDYFLVHRGVNKLVKRTKRHIKLNGWVENSFGRRRRLPHYNLTKRFKDPELKWAEARAQRQGLNAIIQGEAADIFKHSIVRVHALFKGTKSRIVNLVHDDVQMHMHRDDIHLIPQIKKILEDFKYKVPLKVDCSVSAREWGNKTGVDGNDVSAIITTLTKQGFNFPHAT